LTALFATSLASFSNTGTLPLTTFFSAAFINLLVPSGGGQWAIQGPIAMQSAVATGIDPAKMVMAVAYGDQLTNMLQPFWALPLLAITKVEARDIVGYTAVAMIAGAVWISLGLLLF
jgi:short-chain fatty acids transporter